MKCEFDLGEDGIIEIEKFDNGVYRVRGSSVLYAITEEFFATEENNYKITMIDGRIALSRAETVWHLITVKELT
jgi:hypothetical protein